jgi:hypothetical protein
VFNVAYLFFFFFFEAVRTRSIRGSDDVSTISKTI